MCEGLEDMEGGGGPGMRGSMINGHLWSELAPATRPACCISAAATLSWQCGDRELMTPGSPASTSVPGAYALPDYVAIHLRVFGSQPAAKKKTSCQGIHGHVTHSLVTVLEVKANRESEKEEK